MKNRCPLILIILLTFSCNKVSNNKTSIKSNYYTDSIYSKYLGEYRKHNIYLPKGFDIKNKYPIIYATDGGSKITKKKNILDSLIDNNIIEPIIFIASFSNTKIADSTSTITGDGKKVYLNYRNFEYVDRKPSRTEDSLLVNRFQNHMFYFSDELIPTIEKTFNQKLSKNNRYFYGVSNGAGFGLSLLNTYPELIGTYICFSTFGGDIQTNPWQKDVEYPFLYLEYGSNEPFFLKEDAEFIKSKYKELDLSCEVKEFNGGHDNEIWNKEFAVILSKALGSVSSAE